AVLRHEVAGAIDTMIPVVAHSEIERPASVHPPSIVHEERVGSEACSKAADRDWVVLQHRRTWKELRKDTTWRRRAVRVRWAHDARRAEDPIIATGLMVVRETLVVERVEAEHDAVRPRIPGRLEVGRFGVLVVVVSVLRIANAAECRRPVAQVSS